MPDLKRPISIPQEALQISDEEIDRRKAFLEFGEKDVRILRELNATARRYADEMIEDLYKHFLSFDETRAFFRDPQLLQRVKQAQKEYFVQLTEGDYGRDYVQGRLRIGAVHERIGLEGKWYLGAYNFYKRTVFKRIMQAFKKDPEKGLQAILSLSKLVFLDIGLAIDTYIFQREKTIRQQQEAIRELSTPVLQIREQLSLLSIVGVIDSQRAKQLTAQLLRTIRANRSKVVVIDITGVPSIDSKVANHLVQTVDACRLMGAKVIVTGLSPEIAQTLVTIGVDLTKLNTVGDLQGGIEQAESLLGYKVVRTEQETV